MGQLLEKLQVEVETLAELHRNEHADVDLYFEEAWQNIDGKSKFTRLILNEAAAPMGAYISLLAKRKCFGCEHECGSQKDHDMCLQDPEEILQLFFDEAWQGGVSDALKVILKLWMK